MHSHWPELALGAALILATYQRAAAQHPWEAGVQSIGTLSDPALIVGGGYVARRTSGRSRASLSMGVGVAGDEFVWRGEALVHFLLNPDELRKPGFYLAGGIAGSGGDNDRGYLVLTLGLEQRPGGTSGWDVEAGVGGGVRFAAGYRWRW